MNKSRSVGAIGGAVLMVALFSGCASAGNDSIAKLTPDTAKQHFVQGKTTESDVRELIGDPMGTTYLADGTVQWGYVWAHSSASATDFIPFNMHQTGSEHTKSLTLLFDAHGVLEKYTLSDSHGRYCGGIGC